MQQDLTIIVLLLLIAASSVALFLDARQRRMERQVAIALSSTYVESAPSLRRAPVESRWRIVHRLANYKPGTAVVLRPAFVLLLSALAPAAIFYANRYLGFSTPRVSVVAFVAAVVSVRGLFGWQRRRLADQLIRQLPDTISMVTGAVRSGLPVNEAFRAVSREMPQPTAGQFAQVCSELALGRSPEEAIDGVYQRTDVAEYGFFAVTLGVQLKAGGGLAETLQTLGDTVRQRVALAARAKALAAEVIFSARALSVAPIIVGGLLYMLNPSTVDLLLTDPTGHKLLAFAASSVLVGTLVIRWMIRRDTAL